MRRVAIVCTIALLAVSCGGEDVGSQKSSPKEQSDPGTAANATPAEATDPLTGTWQTSRITPAAVTSFLKDIGLGKTAKVVVEDLGYPTWWTLEMSDGGYHTTRDDSEGVDEGSYEIDGDRVVLNAGSGDVVYRWKIRAKSSRFDL